MSIRQSIQKIIVETLNDQKREISIRAFLEAEKQLKNATKEYLINAGWGYSAPDNGWISKEQLKAVSLETAIKIQRKKDNI